MIHDIIWSDGPSLEFRNKFMEIFLQSICQKHKRPFSWKYFSRSHGNGVVDEIGDKAKAVVYVKVVSKGDDFSIIFHKNPIPTLIRYVYCSKAKENVIHDVFIQHKKVFHLQKNLKFPF